jgi:hypothetical protein
MHSPSRQDEAMAARALGGQRRRRHEADGSPVGSMADLDTLDKVLGYAVRVTLGADKSVTQARALAALVTVGLQLHQRFEVDERILALETRIDELSEPWRVAG